MPTAVQIHLHAFERRERNGKWRVRSVHALPDLSPEADEGGRYKHLLTAEGATVEDASAAAWAKFRSDPALRPYFVQIIKAI